MMGTKFLRITCPTPRWNLKKGSFVDYCPLNGRLLGAGKFEGGRDYRVEGPGFRLQDGSHLAVQGNNWPPNSRNSIRTMSIRQL